MSNLSETNSKTCEWKHDEICCGASTVPGRNYCEEHLWRVYARGTAVRARPRKEKKIQIAESFISELQEAYDELVAEGKIIP